MRLYKIKKIKNNVVVATTTPTAPNSENSREISIFDTENPYSVINKVPARVREAVLSVDDKMLMMDSEDLRELLKPTATMNSLRRAFWDEYDRACRGNKVMVVNKIYAGVLRKENFYRAYLTSPEKMAWILTPVTDHRYAMEELYETTCAGMRQATQALMASLYKKNGDLNIPAINTLMKIQQQIEQRIYGAVTQRIEQKTLTVKGELSKEGTIDIDKDLLTLKKELLENKIKEDPTFGEDNLPSDILANIVPTELTRVEKTGKDEDGDS